MEPTHITFYERKFMVRTFCFFVVSLFAVSIGFAQDINGKWKGQMESPNGPMELVFNFTTAGDTLTGTVESPMGELPFSKGKISGKTFSFDVTAGNDMVIHHDCTAMGDSISMKVPAMMGGEDMQLMLKRVADNAK